MLDAIMIKEKGPREESLMDWVKIIKDININKCNDVCFGNVWSLVVGPIRVS